MQIYTVGGAVRDKLLGRPSKDHDRVVVGGSAADMLKAGFRQVGADFPVFLCPETQDEYALARVERKTAAGYHGFTVDTEGVTLEEDLSRRDLTINAMAEAEDGTVIDPYGGQLDLANKVLRHVSEAFAEDPVRVLRLARFWARFGPDWSVAAETRALMHTMISSGELDALVPERVWAEFEKGFGEPYPHLMVSLLKDLGVFDRPGFVEYANFATFALSELAYAAEQAISVQGRVAMMLCRDWDRDEVKASRIPSDVREAAQGLYRVRKAAVQDFPSWSAEQKLTLLESLDVLRRPACFDTVCEVLALRHAAVARSLQDARLRLRQMDQGAVVKGISQPLDIKAAIRGARLKALTA